MSKNKKISISVAAAMRRMARWSFVVFLLLFFLSAAATALITFNLQSPDISDGLSLSGTESGGLFGVNRAKEYREVFFTIDQRQKENDLSASADYPHIFRELTE